jgi:hypothetical protein
MREEQKDFEKNRIKVLQQERVDVQKKTFTKWCNAYLSKVSRISFGLRDKIFFHK